MSTNKEFNQGNQYELIYNVKNADGSVKDLSATAEIEWVISRSRIHQPAVSFTLADPEIVILDAVNGKLKLILTAETSSALEPRLLYHEVRHRDTDGVPTTLISESITINSRLLKE